MTGYDYDGRVATGIEYLDHAYDGPSWCGEALLYALAGSPSRDLWRCVATLARRPPEVLLGDRHSWDLAHGLTVDYSRLGYPVDGNPTPRDHRERRAWAELEAAWWRALAP